MSQNVLIGVLALNMVLSSLGCTTIVVGKKATSDSSVMVTHSNDGEGATDPRLVHIPAADYPHGSMRKIYPAPESYPRFVSDPNSPVKAYHPKGNQKPFEPIGSIPQVPHTYSYKEETYAAINEHQVAIGESTCSAVFATKAKGAGGNAIMSIDALTRLALERSKTSKEAVSLMGKFAVEYGFYGSDSFEGSAESLLVIDPNEGWIFHILPDPTGSFSL